MATRFYLHAASSGLAGLPTAEKKDSQGICFLGKVAISDFLRRYIPEKKGAVVSTAGKELGEHKGAQFYTIGQRHGIGISVGQEPYYVARKDTETNTVILAKQDDPMLRQKDVTIKDVNFIDERNRQFKDKAAIDVLARTRYRAPLVKAKLSSIGDDSYNLEFDEPQMFIAPGQSAVFYTKKGELIGGGVIV